MQEAYHLDGVRAVRSLGFIACAPPLLVSTGRHGRVHNVRGGRPARAPVIFVCGGDERTCETRTLTHFCGVCSFPVASCFILRF